MEKAMNRQRVLLQHLNPSSVHPPQPHDSTISPLACSSGNDGGYQRNAASGDDVVIVAAYRTAICKSKRGGFKDTLADDLLAPVLKVENFPQARDCLLPMGITSENVAQHCGVTRQEQDQAAIESHRRAAEATASGKFREEIVPIVDPKTGEEKYVTICLDDGIRPSTNMMDLAKLKPSFKKDGTSTAGNSSQVSDGAGAVLLMKRSLATKKGLPILGVFRSFAAVGVDPAVMGIGPALAIPAAVKSAGLKLDDIDLFEINEAFASQYVYCRKRLNLDPAKVNVNGGAIALGHPLGATGARCVATLLNEMKRRGSDCRFGVISMCIGSGMGAAAVLERGDHADGLTNTGDTQQH
ncbi:3-ketoacyl-CoA thiolase 2 peroxisomal [Bienertia sinuspersici]